MNEIWVVKARRGGVLEFDAPKKLFEFRMINQESGSRVYAVTADGSRILAITTPEANRARQIEVVTDWTTTLTTRR